mgnify:CR=1 FL=1
MLTNIGMGILLTACGNGGMDPVDTGGEDEYVPVRVETVTDNGIGTRAVTLSNAAIGIFRTAPYSATFPQQYNVECIHDGTAWSLASKIYVGSTDASLHAYYPYGKVRFEAQYCLPFHLSIEEVQVDQNSDATCNEWKNILCGT